MDKHEISRYLDRVNNKESYLFYINYWDRGVISFYYIVRDVFHASKRVGNNLGLIKRDVYADHLFSSDLILNHKDYEIKLFISDKNTDQIYGTQDKSEWDEYRWTITESLKDGEAEVIINDDRYLAFQNQIPKYDCTITTLIHYKKINRAIHEALTPAIFVNIFFFIVLFIICFIFSSSMTVQLRSLLEKIKRIESGELNIGWKLSGRDEFAVIDRSINNMTKKLKN